MAKAQCLAYFLRGFVVYAIASQGDAALANPEIYEALEERGMKHAIRIPAGLLVAPGRKLGHKYLAHNECRQSGAS